MSAPHATAPGMPIAWRNWETWSRAPAAIAPAPVFSLLGIGEIASVQTPRPIRIGARKMNARVRRKLVLSAVPGAGLRSRMRHVLKHVERPECRGSPGRSLEIEK